MESIQKFVYLWTQWSIWVRILFFINFPKFSIFIFAPVLLCTFLLSIILWILTYKVSDSFRSEFSSSFCLSYVTPSVNTNSIKNRVLAIKFFLNISVYFSSLRFARFKNLPYLFLPSNLVYIPIIFIVF